MTRKMTGAKMIVQALIDQGVDTVFGYPGGAVLPIYDEVFQQNSIKHVLVRHEQGAVHAAERAVSSQGAVRVSLHVRPQFLKFFEFLLAAMMA